MRVTWKLLTGGRRRLCREPGRDREHPRAGERSSPLATWEFWNILGPVEEPQRYFAPLLRGGFSCGRPRRGNISNSSPAVSPLPLKGIPAPIGRVPLPSPLVALSNAGIRWRRLRHSDAGKSKGSNHQGQHHHDKPVPGAGGHLDLLSNRSRNSTRSQSSPASQALR